VKSHQEVPNNANGIKFHYPVCLNSIFSNKNKHRKGPIIPLNSFEQLAYVNSRRKGLNFKICLILVEETMDEKNKQM